MDMSSSKKWLSNMANESPLVIVGVINAYTAKLAEQAGFKALYISGAGVANASYGFPDLAMTNLTDVMIDVERIVQATSLPVMVDIDTGFGSNLNIERTIQAMQHAGVAVVHIEDQVMYKRCGHRANKQLVSVSTMCRRLESALEARERINGDILIMARTDAVAPESLDAAINRAQQYENIGADMIFAEALTTLEDYKIFANAIKTPLLANLTEFGKTPTLSRDDLAKNGVAMALYPLTLFRAMNAASRNALKVLRNNLSQDKLLEDLETRDNLYDTLDYINFETRLESKEGSND